MDKARIAREVLDAVGGRGNVLSNTVCMTRLRLSLNDPSQVDYESLSDVSGVLGYAVRGGNGLEVVFGPRMIDGVYHAFIQSTGLAAGIGDLFPMSRQETNMRVQIRAAKKDPSPRATNAPLIDEREMSMLEDLFGARDDDGAERGMRLIVINGPNLNMLGSATKPSSNDDFPSLLELCKETARECGFSRCDCFQSNHEGDLVDKIQDTLDAYDAIAINPGAYGDSAALRDALRAIPAPAVEVHRHRHDSCDQVGTACLSWFSGDGNAGYATAIRALAEHLAL